MTQKIVYNEIVTLLLTLKSKIKILREVRKLFVDIFKYQTNYI